MARSIDGSSGAEGAGGGSGVVPRKVKKTLPLNGGFNPNATTESRPTGNGFQRFWNKIGWNGLYKNKTTYFQSVLRVSAGSSYLSWIDYFMCSLMKHWNEISHRILSNVSLHPRLDAIVPSCAGIEKSAN